MFISYNFIYLYFIWIIFKISYMVFNNIINYIMFFYVLYYVGEIQDFWIFTGGYFNKSDNSDDDGYTDNNDDADCDND